MSKHERKPEVNALPLAQTDPPQPDYAEPELYVEPARMDRRDVLGVVAALFALLVIGVSGYVWLNPGLSAGSLLTAFRPEGRQVHETPSVATTGGGEQVEHIDCPYCGMWADTSEGAVAVMWAGGGSATFDSFDCVFNYLQEEGVSLESGTVKNFPPGSEPEWIDLKTAYYLFDTEKMVKGSMTPYVAAFATRELAAAAQPEMGGEVVDFAALEGKWK